MSSKPEANCGGWMAELVRAWTAEQAILRSFGRYGDMTIVSSKIKSSFKIPPKIRSEKKFR
jgi:hypothetical protein